ncbi:hypothetical protein, partial [Siminovitchia sp. 179-K 8D1 HS]|uniref:hypothetical protein n=1 Tax=Siminovitchia sp. 179-K 8D1 HS TaxID=3142385 RepID=UPI0039A27CF0
VKLSHIYQNLGGMIIEIISKIFYSSKLDEKNEELAQKYAREMDVYELSEEESAAWDKALEPAWDRWAEDLEKRGFNANETIKKYREIQKELGYDK